MKISVVITLKKDVLDPQGKVIHQTLDGMGFNNINEVRQGKYFEIDTKENDPQKAVNTAREMFIRLQELNRDNSSKGYPEIKVGIGINYGEVISGNIGSDRQMNYTVIGDNVNLAARLCSHAKPGQIVISRSVFEKLDNHKGFKSMNPIELKGKSKKVQNWIFDAKN